MIRDERAPSGKKPPQPDADFSGWGKALPPVDENLINESFEQFEFPADDEWEQQHEARAKLLEGELENLKLRDMPPASFPMRKGVADDRERETEESFFSFNADEFPGKEQLDTSLDEESLKTDQQINSMFRNVLDEPEERAPPVPISHRERQIWNTPTPHAYQPMPGAPAPHADPSFAHAGRRPEEFAPGSPSHIKGPPGPQHHPPAAGAAPADALKKLLGIGGGAAPPVRLAPPPPSGGMSVDELERRILQAKPAPVTIQARPGQQPPHASEPQRIPQGQAKWGPKPGAAQATSSPAASPGTQEEKGERKFRQLVNYKRWTENKQYMTAEEIDSIIRMQMIQLQTDNPYVDDFYYQLYLRKTGKPALADEISPQAYHKPICEASPRVQKKYNNELLAGVLGRIPSHSVRAPRPLVVIQRESEGEEDTSLSKDKNDDNFFLLSVMHSVLLAIEDAYNCLLDIEDIDSIRTAIGPPSEGAQYLQNKRRGIADELFKLLNVCIPNDQTPMVPDPNNQYIFSQDEFFIRLSLIPKGRRLVVRALRVLSQEQVHFILLTYVRNFRIFVDPPKSKEAEIAALFEGVLRAVLRLAMPSVVLIFQTIYYFYLNGGLTPLQFIKIKQGGRMIQALFKRSAELHAEGDPSRSHPALQHTWTELYNTIFHQLIGQLSKLFGPDPAQWNDTWEFLALLAANANELQKVAMFDELRDRLRTALKDNPWSGVRVVLGNLGKSHNDL